MLLNHLGWGSGEQKIFEKYSTVGDSDLGSV